MVILTLKLEKAEEDGLFYLTEGTSISGYEVIDGKLYTEDGEYAGKIINLNQHNDTLEIRLELERWMYKQMRNFKVWDEDEYTYITFDTSMLSKNRMSVLIGLLTEMGFENVRGVGTKISVPIISMRFTSNE